MMNGTTPGRGGPVPDPGFRTAHASVHGVVALLVMAGCAGEDRTPEPREPEITDSGGIRTVVNHEPHWGPGEEWTVSAEPVLRIGMVDGPPEYLFDRIRGVTRLSDGTIVVLNSGDGQVRYFDARGEHIRSVGGAGNGPGEIRAGRWLQRLEGDVVQVTHTNGALRYGPDGSLIADHRLDWGRIHALGRVAGIASMGGFLMEACDMPTPLFLGERVLLCTTTFSDVRFMPQEPGIHESVSLVGTSDWSLESLDTIGVFVMSSRAAYRAEGRVHSVRFVAPHGPWGRLDVSGSPPQLVFTDARAYRIERHALDGSGKLLVIERAGALRPATDLERSRFDSAFAAEPTYRPAGNPDDFRGQLSVADSLSIISGEPFVDDLLAVWAPTETRPEQNERVYDVFGADGVYFGQVILPSVLRLHEIGEDYVLGVTWDALGVEYVTMYRLNGRSSPAGSG